MTYAIGCLNPYFSIAVFIKTIDPTGKRYTFTSLPDREGLADATLFSLARARHVLEFMPPHSFIIACTADEQAMMALNEREARPHTKAAFEEGKP